MPALRDLPCNWKPETGNRKLLVIMNANWKKSISSAAALIVLGVAALYGGPKLLALIIPVGMVVWYGTATTVRSGRN